MALYEYKCSECGGIEEKIVNYNDADKIKLICEKCQKPRKRILSIPGYVWSPSRSKK